MTEKNLYLDIHVLQTVPSSNLNRDDSGAPKTAYYGGVNRARVSSQSWKRAMREYFKRNGVKIGTRTLDLQSLFEQELQKQAPSLTEEELKDGAHKIAGLVAPQSPLKKADKETDKQEVSKKGALVMLSAGQVEKITKYALELGLDQISKADKKAVAANLLSNDSLDLALFGRMMASNPELNVEATSQVAHAISTHEVIPEFDYFTAMDDLHPEKSGAAMIGTVGFDSATFYRYANVNVKELAHDLGDQQRTIEGVRDFIKAFALSMPTGKENTFANKTLPQYILVVLRSDTPVNLVSAFEEPIRSQNGYLKKSIEKLEDTLRETQKLVDFPLWLGSLSTEYSTLTSFDENIKDYLAKITDNIEREL